MTLRAPGTVPQSGVWKDQGVTINPQRCAILALHWQVNVIKLEGLFAPTFSVGGP
jgi:hypothetical protein